jgi:hypothetical protein
MKFLTLVLSLLLYVIVNNKNHKKSKQNDVPSYTENRYTHRLRTHHHNQHHNNNQQGQGNGHHHHHLKMSHNLIGGLLGQLGYTENAISNAVDHLKEEQVSHANEVLVKFHKTNFAGDMNILAELSDVLNLPDLKDKVKDVKNKINVVEFLRSHMI